MDASSWIALGVFVALSLAAASTGARFKPGPWYAALTKPKWTPPNWMFPVVWGLLYAAITTAGFLVWRASGVEAMPALVLYVVSLGLNGAWSLLFFGRRRMDLALIDVVLLWLSIVGVLVAFAVHSPLAAWLIAPYLAWVSIAGLLNLQMIQLNPRAVRGAV